ncbi:hypothetical protein MAH1_33450 [Sessilibacter sp. MAH1]
MTILIAGNSINSLPSLSLHGQKLTEYDGSIKYWLTNNISGSEYYSFESESQMFSLLFYNLLSTPFVYKKKYDVILSVDKFYDIDEAALIALEREATATKSVSSGSEQDGASRPELKSNSFELDYNLITLTQLDELSHWLESYNFNNLDFLSYLSVENKETLIFWVDFTTNFSCLSDEKIMSWLQKNSRSTQQFCYNLLSIHFLNEAYLKTPNNTDAENNNNSETLLSLKKSLDKNLINSLFSMLASPAVVSAPDQTQLQQILVTWFRDQQWIGFDTIYDAALVMLNKIGVHKLLDDDADLYIKDQMGQMRTLLTNTDAVKALKAQFVDAWDYYYHFDNKELVVRYFNQSLFVKSWQQMSAL